MKNLLTTLLCLVSISIMAQEENLTGKWISKIENNVAETITYDFKKDFTLEMFFDGKELPTKGPIKYDVSKRSNISIITINYTSPWNNSNEQMYGLIQFLNDNEIKMQFFPNNDKKMEELNFDNEALVFSRI